MTLLDAPQYNAARERRKRIIIVSTSSTLVTLFIVWWLICGHPIAWPWNWNTYLFGKSTVNHFFTAIEQNDLNKAYGIWFQDPNWQQHPAVHNNYSFQRFQQDWGPNSPDNDYGPIKSHRIAAERISGNVLIVAIYVNDRKSNPIFLAYDPKNHTLIFSPVQLYLGP
jgi:hypothetical protein